VEKQKSAKDLKNKKEKKKNLERQAHVGRSPGKAGSLRRTLPTRTMVIRATTAVTILRGWRPALTGSSRVRCKPTSPSHGRETLRERRVGLAIANRGSLLHAVLALTPLQRLRRVRPSPVHNCGGINPYTLTARLWPGGLAHYETSSRLDPTTWSFAQGNKMWRSSRILVG